MAWHRMPLRSYSSLGRALAFARVCQRQFPENAFSVRLSPLAGYTFRWLIEVRRADGAVAFVGR